MDLFLDLFNYGFLKDPWFSNNNNNNNQKKKTDLETRGNNQRIGSRIQVSHHITTFQPFMVEAEKLRTKQWYGFAQVFQQQPKKKQWGNPTQGRSLQVITFFTHHRSEPRSSEHSNSSICKMKANATEFTTKSSMPVAIWEKGKESLPFFRDRFLLMGMMGVDPMNRLNFMPQLTHIFITYKWSYPISEDNWGHNPLIEITPLIGINDLQLSFLWI